MPSHDTPSPATTKRPSLSERHSSSQSLSRASPSADCHSTSHKASSHKLHRAHVVGHNRVAHARNPSYGKNLNKLIKITAVHAGGAGAGGGAGDGAMVTRHHIRSKSTTPSTSPQAQHVKRNSSHISLPRTGSKVSVKKNSSVLSLKRNGSVKELEKTADADVSPQVLRLQSQQAKQTRRTPAVKFSIGSEGQDEEWTEDSTSQSPETTRRSSIAQSQELQAELKPRSPALEKPPDTHRASLAQLPPQSPPRPIRRPLDRSTSHRSRILDADAITSRLLQRHPPHMVPPRLSSVSATATPTGSHSPRSYGLSQGSTLNGTPGMPHDGVSRFISGGGSSGGTSGDNSHIPSRVLSTSSPPNGSLDHSKRARSTSHIAIRNDGADEEEDDEDYDEPRALAPRSRQHSAHGPFTTSQSSRTQQKLNLQRASSNMDPPPPYVAPPSLTQGVPNTAPQGPNSQISETTRLAKQYEQACLEYAVVRRYRNPLGEALKRVDDIQGIKEMREKRMQVSRNEEKRGAGSPEKMGLSQSLREDRRPKAEGRGEGRVRFEIGSKDDSVIGGRHDGTDDDDDEDGDGVDGTDRLVRRIWESRNETSGD